MGLDLRVCGAGVVGCGLLVGSIAEADEAGRRQCEGVRPRVYLDYDVDSRDVLLFASMGCVVVFVLLLLVTSLSLILVSSPLFVHRAMGVGKGATVVLRFLVGRTTRIGWRQTYWDWRRHSTEEEGGTSHIW
jgi:hypothetical protein